MGMGNPTQPVVVSPTKLVDHPALTHLSGLIRTNPDRESATEVIFQNVTSIAMDGALPATPTHPVSLADRLFSGPPVVRGTRAVPRGDADPGAAQRWTPPQSQHGRGVSRFLKGSNPQNLRLRLHRGEA